MNSRILHVAVILAFILVPITPYATSARMVVYVTYTKCPICSNDPSNLRFEQYMGEVYSSTTLTKMGVQVRTIDLEPELERDLIELYQKLNVPESMRTTYTLVVSVDEKFLFINHVPVKIVVDFLDNYAERNERIVIFRDESQGLYRVVDNNGNITECKMENSISECASLHLNISPWSFFPLVVISGLLDSFNPCAFSVLLFFVTLIFTMGVTSFPQKIKQMILLLGSTYILAVYLTYLIIGLTLKQVITIIAFPHLISKLGALVLFAIGIIKIKDGFWPGRGITLKLSPPHWEILKKWMRRVTLPATFIAGILVALLEFPCTGGIYFAILGLLATRTTFMDGFAYLLLYNVLFVLPLIVILVLTTRKEVMEFSIRKWQQQEGKRIELAEGLIYIGLGIALLLLGLV